MKLIHAGNVCIGDPGPEVGALAIDFRHGYEEDLQRLIRTCEDEKTDLLLFSGNLFNHRPSEEELQALDKMLSVLTHTRVFIVTGVKDSAEQGDAYWTHEWKSRTMVFLGDSLQRVHVPSIGTEITCCGYSEKNWSKVRPEKIQRGKKGQYQVLLLPFMGEDESEEALEKAVADCGDTLRFDYVALGNQATRLGVDEYPVYSVRRMEPDVFEEEPTTGVFEAVLSNDRKLRGQPSVRLLPVTENTLEVLKAELDPEKTADNVVKELRDLIAEKGKEKVYQIRLTGRPAPAVRYLTDTFRECGNIAGIIDETEKDPEEKEDEAARLFAEEIAKLPESRIRTAALKRGIEALFAGKERAE